MRFLRVRAVVEMVGLSKSTLYARIRDGSFPRPIQIGAQTVVFLESEIFDWMKDKAARRAAKPAHERSSASTIERQRLNPQLATKYDLSLRRDEACARDRKPRKGWLTKGNS
jgi:prophage regulatory protein